MLILLRGGEEVLLDVGGQDATEAFEDVGHSDEAREILESMLVGNLKRMVRSPVLFESEDCSVLLSSQSPAPFLISETLKYH